MRKQWLIFLQLAFETRGTASWHDSITLCEKRRLAGDNNVSDTFEGKRVKEQRGGKQISPSASYRHTHRNTSPISTPLSRKRENRHLGAHSLWLSSNIVPVLRAKSFCSVQRWHYQKRKINSNPVLILHFSQTRRPARADGPLQEQWFQGTATRGSWKSPY